MRNRDTNSKSLLYVGIALTIVSHTIVVCTAFQAEFFISMGNTFATPFMVCYGLIGGWIGMLPIIKHYKTYRYDS